MQQRSDVLPYSIASNNNEPFDSYVNSKTYRSVRSSLSSTVQYPISLYHRQIPIISNMAPYLGPTGNIVPGFYQGGNRIIFNGNFGCKNNIANKFEGTIRGIGDNAIKILSNNGEIVVGAISSCTLAYGPKPDYQISVGDKVTFYG